jgi:hypothetical protein
MSSSPLVAALDPRVNEQVVQDQMQNPIPSEPGAESEPEDDTPREQPDAGSEKSFTEARP